VTYKPYPRRNLVKNAWLAGNGKEDRDGKRVFVWLIEEEYKILLWTLTHL